MKLIKQRYEIDNHLLENGEVVCIGYNPRESFYIEEDFTYKDGVLYSNSPSSSFKIDLACNYSTLFIDAIRVVKT